jgi:2-C-methyl-D-erythritol 4-phosphate cytidylyltransferase
MKRRNTAVLLAGGVGARVGLDTPKQLLKVAGKPLMEHALAAFDRHPDVDEVIVMMAPGYLDPVRKMVRDCGYIKVVDILEGATTRSGTTMRAIDRMCSECAQDTKVLFHDAVRPLLSARIISDCFQALETYGAVDVAIPSADTIIEVDDDDSIVAVPPRARLRRGQTPQGFRLGVISEAYAIASKDSDFVATDDCSVVLKYLPDIPIRVVPGDHRNMKVTEPIDLYIADKLFQLTDGRILQSRTEEGYRVALANKTFVVFGGSYGIGADMARLGTMYGANVAVFSRSTTGTHVERRREVAEAAQATLDRYGSIDFVVNTAGVLPRGDLIEATDETIWGATEINYLAPILIAQEFYPHLRATKGSLLLFASSSYTRGRSGYSLYSSAKAAIVNLTQALADEWAAEGIMVNCVNPERTRTPMRTNAFGVEPPGTLLESEAVARAALEVLLSRSTGHIFDLRREDYVVRAQPSDSMMKMSSS